MGAVVGCCGCGDRHGRNQEYHGMAPAIEPMQQGSDNWNTDSHCATELTGLGAAKAPPEESLPSIDKLGLSVSPCTRSTRSQNRTFSPAVFEDINPGSFSISPRTIPSPRFNAASSQVCPSPVRSLSLPPLVFPHVECDVGADLRLWRMASSPLLGEFALSPRSVRTENCGDDEAIQTNTEKTNTETSHEALGAPWPWAGTVAVGPGVSLSARCCTPADQTQEKSGDPSHEAALAHDCLASISAEPVIAG